MLSFHIKFVQTDGQGKTICPRSFDTGHKKKKLVTKKFFFSKKKKIIIISYNLAKRGLMDLCDALNTKHAITKFRIHKIRFVAQSTEWNGPSTSEKCWPISICSG